MTENLIIINYGELNLRGKNRPAFIKQLEKNIKNILHDYQEHLVYDRTYDHIYIFYSEEIKEKLEDIVDRLKDVSGIFSFGLGIAVKSDPDTIIKESLELLKSVEHPNSTFKIVAKRIDKSFYPISDTLKRDIAKQVLIHTKLKVDVKNPEYPLNVKVYPKKTYIYYRVEKGSGGLPIGTSKKALMMISGGIDSPVASYLLMKRGVYLDFIHFASPPYTSSGVIDKINDLLKVLNRYQGHIRMFIVPFTEVQEAIYKYTDESYAITLLRRKMFEIATIVARNNNCYALATGESLGQVASQTIVSLSVINEVTNIPVLRPVITYDKDDIIKISRKIGTYDISIRPFVDCCTIFTPVNPKTAPNLKITKSFESRFDYEPLVLKAIQDIEVCYIDFKNKDSIDEYL